MIGPAIYISEGSRLYVLLALLFAAWGKSANVEQFKEAIAKSFPRLGRASGFVAISIIGTEWLIAALMLFGGVQSRIGLAAALGLFILFTTVISWALLLGNPVVCNCFGSSGHRISVHDLFRNILFIGASWLGLHYSSTAGSIGVIAYVALAGIALILLLLSIALQDIATLLRVRAD